MTSKCDTNYDCGHLFSFNSIPMWLASLSSTSCNAPAIYSSNLFKPCPQLEVNCSFEKKIDGEKGGVSNDNSTPLFRNPVRRPRKIVLKSPYSKLLVSKFILHKDVNTYNAKKLLKERLSQLVVKKNPCASHYVSLEKELGITDCEDNVSHKIHAHQSAPDLYNTPTYQKTFNNTGDLSSHSPCHKRPTKERIECNVSFERPHKKLSKTTLSAVVSIDQDDD